MLATRNVDDDGEWYLLPGGGQHHGETLQETLQRECQEEIGAPVQIGELRYVCEYIGKSHEFAETDGGTHQVEFMFTCEVDADYAPRNGPTTDTFQTGVVWLPVSDLHLHRFYPKSLGPCLRGENAGAHDAYLGDAN